KFFEYFSFRRLKPAAIHILKKGGLHVLPRHRLAPPAYRVVGVFLCFKETFQRPLLADNGNLHLRLSIVRKARNRQNHGKKQNPVKGVFDGVCYGG
ncbi:MAG: hypothetical protein K9H16_01350, partial [Bacteroidales bacterium]|nr:hypothetical protein [Bacteroidales bacterium]